MYTFKMAACYDCQENSGCQSYHEHSHSNKRNAILK